MLNANKTLFSLANFLIIILPVSLVSGPFLSDLSVVLLDLIFLYILIIKKNWKILNKVEFKYLILFCIFISIRSLFTKDIPFSLWSSITYCRFIIFIFAINFFLSKSNFLLENFAKSLCWAFAIVSADGYFQYFTGHNIFWVPLENKDKLNIFIRNEAIIGSYLIRLLPLLVAMLIIRINFKKNYWLISFFLFSILLLIFFSGSRSSFFMSILFLLFLFFYLKEIRKYLVFIIILSIIILSFLFTYNEKIRYSVNLSLVDPINTIFKVSNKQMEELKIKNSIIIFTPVYNSHYITAYKMFSDNKLFGQGTNMYRKICSDEKFITNEFSCTTHPHNFYIQLLAENGIIGFAMIFLIFIIIILKLFQNHLKIESSKKSKKFLLANHFILFGIFLNLWPVIPTGNFFGGLLSILIYLPVGFYLYLNNKKK
jgi:O-antigen ligase